MGLDCRLLPVECDRGDWGYSHSIIPLDRVSALFDAIRKLPDAGPVPPKFSTFCATVPDGENEGEPGYGDTQEDPYGQPLRCIYAGDIAKIKVKGMTDPTCLAALAYCACLPPKQRIAVYWH